jgi:hypothetical protein
LSGGRTGQAGARGRRGRLIRKENRKTFPHTNYTYKEKRRRILTALSRPDCIRSFSQNTS